MDHNLPQMSFTLSLPSTYHTQSPSTAQGNEMRMPKFNRNTRKCPFLSVFKDEKRPGGEEKGMLVYFIYRIGTQKNSK